MFSKSNLHHMENINKMETHIIKPAQKYDNVLSPAEI